MSDIVERLRNDASEGRFHNPTNPHSIFWDEIADEIERLRSLLADIESQNRVMWDVANDREALLAETEASNERLGAIIDSQAVIDDEKSRRLAEAVDLFAEPEIIEETFGPRCSEYEPGCPCCRAWKWLDDNRTPDSALLGKGKP